MDVLDLIKIVLGLNGLVFVALVANTFRIGRLEGRMTNGDYLKCPFYRGSKDTKKCRDEDKK